MTWKTKGNSQEGIGIPHLMLLLTLLLLFLFVSGFHGSKILDQVHKIYVAPGVDSLEQAEEC